MSEFEDVESQSRPYARQTIIITLIVTLALLIVFYTPALTPLRVPLAIVLPLSLVYGIGLAIILFRKGRGPLPIVTFLAGVIFVAGGAALDGIVTLLKSPSLEREANPIARTLLDSGQPTNLVIAYGVITQILLTLLLCMLWAAFLRHRAVLIALIQRQSPTSRLNFIKAGLGAAQLSWRQYFIPVKLSDLPTAYHTLWAMAAIFTGSSLYRWYLGLKWLGMFSDSSSSMAAIVSVLLATALYVLWLGSKYRDVSAEVVEAR